MPRGFGQVSPPGQPGQYSDVPSASGGTTPTFGPAPRARPWVCIGCQTVQPQGLIGAIEAGAGNTQSVCASCRAVIANAHGIVANVRRRGLGQAGDNVAMGGSSGIAKNPVVNGQITTAGSPVPAEQPQQSSLADSQAATEASLAATSANLDALSASQNRIGATLNQMEADRQAQATRQKWIWGGGIALVGLATWAHWYRTRRRRR